MVIGLSMVARPVSLASPASAAVEKAMETATVNRIDLLLSMSYSMPLSDQE
jgi:hypothetical protein